MTAQPKNTGRYGEGNPGKPRGAINRTTRTVREAMAKIAEYNVERFQGWLDDIADDPKHGPYAAARLYLDLIEYHIPKLARTELTGEEGGPIAHIQSHAVCAETMRLVEELQSIGSTREGNGVPQ